MLFGVGGSLLFGARRKQLLLGRFAVGFALSVRSTVSYWGVLVAEQPKSPEEKTRLNRSFAEEMPETCSKDTCPVL
jgi:hypothetical protein